MSNALIQRRKQVKTGQTYEVKLEVVEYYIADLTLHELESANHIPLQGRTVQQVIDRQGMHLCFIQTCKRIEGYVGVDGNAIFVASSFDDYSPVYVVNGEVFPIDSAPEELKKSISPFLKPIRSKFVVKDRLSYGHYATEKVEVIKTTEPDEVYPS